MLSPVLKDKIREVWLPAFKDLERLREHAISKHFTFRQMAGLYAVASICYHEGNHKSMIRDAVFDRLCNSIYENFDQCVQAGANLLKREDVKNHRGNDMEIFVKPYHDVAEVLLGHPCRCSKCTS